MQQLKAELLALIETATPHKLWEIVCQFSESELYKSYVKKDGVIYRLSELDGGDKEEVETPGEKDKPDTFNDVMVTYKGKETKGWWYSKESHIDEHWYIYGVDTCLYGLDIALVTSWREIG